MLYTKYTAVVLASVATVGAFNPLDLVLEARQVPINFTSTSTTAPSSSATLNTTLGGVNGAGSGMSGTMTSHAQGSLHMQVFLSAGFVGTLMTGLALL